MKIIVLDIETTGFGVDYSAIVEIGMVLVDTDTKEITPIFNQIVKDKIFNKYKHKNAWIFNNSILTVEDVEKAKSLEHYRPEIQKWFDKYPITAFNMSFDIRFMKARDFKFTETKCLMHTSRKYIKKQGPPSVEETYEKFFPGEKYIEEHRGYDDAYHEGKILLKLVELKENEKN